MWVDDDKRSFLRKRLLITFLFCLPLIILSLVVSLDAMIMQEGAVMVNSIKGIMMAGIISTPLLLVTFIPVYLLSRTIMRKSGLRIDGNSWRLPSGENIDAERMSSIVYFMDENRIFFARNAQEESSLGELIAALEEEGEHGKRANGLVGGSSSGYVTGWMSIGFRVKMMLNDTASRIPSCYVMSKKQLRSILQERYLEEADRKTVTRTFVYKSKRPAPIVTNKGDSATTTS